NFTDKTVCVTGGAKGIGETLSKAFSAAGANVVVCDIDIGAAQQLCAALGSERALALHCDVADRASVAAAMQQCESRFGGLDILINNAGLHTSAYNRPVTQVPPALWTRLLDVNIHGVVNCSSSAAELMRRRGGGAIVNIGSVSGFDVRTAYGVSKLAVR